MRNKKNDTLQEFLKLYIQYQGNLSSYKNASLVVNDLEKLNDIISLFVGALLKIIVSKFSVAIINSLPYRFAHLEIFIVWLYKFVSPISAERSPLSIIIISELEHVESRFLQPRLFSILETIILF